MALVARDPFITMFDADELAALQTARVGRLATADEDGRPNVVPICYALVESDDGPVELVTPIDEKPKAVDLDKLRRVRDIRTNGRVAVIVDRYTEDWDRLGWIQVRGTAGIVAPGDESHPAAVAALRERYDQYADHDLDHRPVIGIVPGSVRSWGDLSSFER